MDQTKQGVIKTANGDPIQVSMANDDNGAAIILFLMPDGRQVRFTWDLKQLQTV